jgi:hypothetical protein
LAKCAGLKILSLSGFMGSNPFSRIFSQGINFKKAGRLAFLMVTYKEISSTEQPFIRYGKLIDLDEFSFSEVGPTSFHQNMSEERKYSVSLFGSDHSYFASPASLIDEDARAQYSKGVSKEAIAVKFPQATIVDVVVKSSSITFISPSDFSLKMRVYATLEELVSSASRKK